MAIVGAAEVFQVLEQSRFHQLHSYLESGLLRLFVPGEISAKPVVERTGFRMVSPCAIDFAG